MNYMVVVALAFAIVLELRVAKSRKEGMWGTFGYY
jgi:hypothetical protein